MFYFIKWRLRQILGLLSKVILLRNSNLRDTRKIIVFISGGIGDGIMVLPALNALINKFPEAFITLVTTRTIKDVIDTTVNVKNWVSVEKDIIPLLIKEEFDMVFVNVVGVHHLRFLIYALLSGAKYRLGPKYPYEHFSAYNYPYSVSEYKHDVIQNLEMLASVGVKSSNSPPMLNFTCKREAGQETRPYPICYDRLTIGIHPGGDKSQAVKRWPEDKFAKLVNILNKRYNCKLIFFEGKDEQGLCSRMVNLSKTNVAIVKDMPIKKVCGLIGGCNLFITSDSGLGHIADALGVPTITILGPANPNRIAPFRSQDKVLYKGVPCSPCYATTRCIFSKRKCLEEIEPKDIIKVIEDLKNKGKI